MSVEVGISSPIINIKSNNLNDSQSQSQSQSPTSQSPTNSDSPTNSNSPTNSPSQSPSNSNPSTSSTSPVTNSIDQPQTDEIENNNQTLIDNEPEPRSFGLNFLSSFTRTQNNNNNTGTSTNAHQFMANSPTIANFNNIDREEEENDVTIQPDVINEEQIQTLPSVEETNDEQPKVEELKDESPKVEEPKVEEPKDEEPKVDEKITNKIDKDEKLDKKDDGKDKEGFFSLRLTPLIDHSSSNTGLYFAPVIRRAKPLNSISIGRYTEKNKSAAHAPQGSNSPIVFKSKVVSRIHALFQCNNDGQWFIKDCKSSSGTFLNHIRLSPASQESSLMPLIDGDIIQLGMDYRGGTEEVYRCVKMRCEFNKSWQRKVNQFNLEIHKKFKNLSIENNNRINEFNENNKNKTTTNEITNSLKNGIGNGNEINNIINDELSECAICLLKLEPCQALFMSPCSHSWHYKCIRPIIIKSYPQFYCPNCRSMCDLETDIDDDD